MKKIMSMLIIASIAAMCGQIEHDDIEFRNGAVSSEAVVTVTVTLPDGNTYTVDEYTTEATVNTYQSENPVDWDIIKY